MKRQLVEKAETYLVELGLSFREKTQWDFSEFLSDKLQIFSPESVKAS